MGIAQIKQKITSVAQKEEQKIKAEAEKKVAGLQKIFLDEKKKIEDAFQKDLAKKLDEENKKHSSSLNREIKIKTESVKREIMEEVFSEALRGLSTISDDELKKVAERVINSLPKNTEGDLMVPRGKSDIFKKMISGKSSLHVKEDDSVESGFLLVGDQFSYDFSFKSLLASKKTDIELELSKLLF